MSDDEDGFVGKVQAAGETLLGVAITLGTTVVITLLVIKMFMWVFS